ncbi:MAG TPA: hypothetical protein VMS12_08545 [Thermoanaerobaculia bacterium]|nr:hypothetical protein [Thermoanaerobaculia bacterium]
MRRKHPESQHGQAAVEFIFALLFLIALASVMYQALHFELDVFNKMGILRFKSFQRMHMNNQQFNSGFADDNQMVSFKPLSQLTNYRVIFQTVNTNQKYPDKTLYYKRGTQPALPGGLTTGVLVAAGICIGTLDHVESTAGNCVKPFEAINAVLNAIP